jgi:hypothetical protein
MSALGQQRTYSVQKAMPALPPIATTKADMCRTNGHVRFTQKADMCGAAREVCFGPIADITPLIYGFKISAVKFMGLRHGGNTEGADADLTDAQLRALSGHKTVSMTVPYARQTMKQRRDGARKRLAVRAKGSEEL